MSTSLLWRQLSDATKAVHEDLARQLRSDAALSVSEFNVLSTLFEEPNRTWRMTDLARATALTAGSITRVVAKLAQRGLVTKFQSSDDARLHVVVLMPLGSLRTAKASAIEREVLARHFERVAAPEQLRRLQILLATIAHASAPEGTLAAHAGSFSSHPSDAASPAS